MVLFRLDSRSYRRTHKPSVQYHEQGAVAGNRGTCRDEFDSMVSRSVWGMRNHGQSREIRELTRLQGAESRRASMK